MSGEWKQGYPPGKMTPENKERFLREYEVRFTVGGMIWHRKK